MSVLLASCGRISYAPLDETGRDASVADCAGIPLDADASGIDRPWPTLSGEWTWIGGSDVVRQPGVYGTAGEADPGNVPGARDNGGCAAAGGAFWLFGGWAIDESGSGGRINDLWRYEPSTGLWTFLHGSRRGRSNGTYGTRGVSDPGNDPGARNDAMMWSDASGDLWLFGGVGLDQAGCEGKLNDLWRYRSTTGAWTWVGGSSVCDQLGSYGTRGVPAPSNVPGARDSATLWTEDGAVAWLYGGSGLGAGGVVGSLGDLWRYDSADDSWTWVSGSDSTAVAPVQGARGVASATSDPGSRIGSCGWTAEGELWLFGGIAADGRRNDLWRYDVATGLWAWMAGSATALAAGVFGERDVAAAANTPGARVGCIAWRDLRGHLWLFGGRGIDSAGTDGALNDLWMFDRDTGLWTWVGGSELADQPGTYGTRGTSDPANTPGGRNRGGSWARPDGSLWLFGGDDAYDSAGTFAQLNDLWRFAAR